MKCLITGIFLSLFIIYANAKPYTFSPDTQYQVCFTPGRSCSHILVNYIANAKQTIYVQAYTFTSYILANALVKAHQRGIKVFIILDQSNFSGTAPTRLNYFKA